MNCIYRYIIAIAIMVSAIACQKGIDDEVLVPKFTPRDVTFSASITATNAQSDETSSIGINQINAILKSTWETDDLLGGYSSNAEYPQTNIEPYSVSDIYDDGAEANFSGRAYGSKLRFIYPFNNTRQDIVDGEYCIDITSQICDMNNPYANVSDNLFLISGSEQDVTEIESSGVTMQQLGAILDIRLTCENIPAGYTLAEIVVDGSNVNMPAAQYIDLTQRISETSFVCKHTESAISIAVENMAVNENSTQYTIPISILPFTIDSGNSIDVFLRFVGEQNEIYCKTKTSNAESNIIFASSQHYFIYVNTDFTSDQTTDFVMIGDGTEESPFLINSKSKLEYLSRSVNNGVTYKGKFIALTCDIDLDGNEERQWIAIGGTGKPFMGSFDGRGHHISGLYINKPESDYQGLFGYVSEGIIKNIGVSGSVKGANRVAGVVGAIGSPPASIYNCYNNSDVCGAEYTIGGVVGLSHTSIDRCYNTGNISGDRLIGGVAGSSLSTTNCYNAGNISGTGEYAIGGVVGSASSSLSYDIDLVANCYNTGNVISDGSVGGVVGSSDSTVDNCYNSGKIQGDEESGGVISRVYPDGSATNCYYQRDCGAYGKGTAKTKEEMQSEAFVELLNINAGWSSVTYDVDLYSWKCDQQSTPSFDDKNNAKIWDGAGTEANPYLIKDAEGLRMLSISVNNYNLLYRDKFFKVTNDIDLGGINANGDVNSDYEWTAIGTEANPFNGTFDGDGHLISGIYINKPNSDYQGLFGNLYAAIIINVGVSGSIIGRECVGGIAGYSYAFIRNCYNEGNITGDKTVGGIVGNCQWSVSDCCNNGNIISSSGSVGGIVGKSYSSITDCCNTGNISGSGYAGGIAGLSYPGAESSSALFNSCFYISNCYNTGRVEGSGSAGGIIGFSASYSQYQYIKIVNCYNTGYISANTTAYGIDGSSSYLNSTVSVTNCYYRDDYGAEGCGTAMPIPEMQTEDFAKTLNENAVWYNISHNSKSLQQWIFRQGNTPSLNYNETAQVWAGVGSESDPFLIESAEDLKEIHYYGVTYDLSFVYDFFRLTNDIDLGGIDANGNINNENEWTAIGTDDDPFMGSFDGGGHLISGLYINKPESECQGLFGNVKKGRINGIRVSGSITGGYNVGGIVGRYDSDSLKDCYNDCDINGSSQIGGIVGYSFSGWTTNCHNTGRINGVYYVGGIAGSLHSAIKNCSNTCNVIGNKYVGGIAGYASNLYSCRNTGDVTGSINVGGIAGEYYTITDCENTGSVIVE